MDINSLKDEFMLALVNFEKDKARSLFEEYIQSNNASMFIDNIIVEVLEEIGDKWDKGEFSLSQVYLSSKICEELITQMLPAQARPANNTLKIAIVTLEDHHVLGKKIVKSILKSSGFDIIDYGHGVSSGQIIQNVISDNIDILLISVLMYPSALKIKNIREKLSETGHNIKILAGGAPFRFDHELWKQVGADAMGHNAADAIKIINNWIQEAPLNE